MAEQEVSPKSYREHGDVCSVTISGQQGIAFSHRPSAALGSTEEPGQPSGTSGALDEESPGSRVRFSESLIEEACEVGASPAQALENVNVTSSPGHTECGINQDFLTKQLRNLAAKERELEATLDQERIENFIEKVEGEVELEQVINEILHNLTADAEAQEMERREREFATERREVQLEEELGMLQGKIRGLEDELGLVHAEKDMAPKKKEEMDDIIQSMLTEMRPTKGSTPEVAAEGCSSASKDSERIATALIRRTAASAKKPIFLAFEDILKEADERAEQDQTAIESALHAEKNLENVLEQEQRRSQENAQQLESRLLAVETEVSRLAEVLRECEMTLSVEQEKRKEARLEVDQLLKMWWEEKKLLGLCDKKVLGLVSFLVSIKEKLTTGGEGGENIISRLASIVKHTIRIIGIISYAPCCSIIQIAGCLEEINALFHFLLHSNKIS